MNQQQLSQLEFSAIVSFLEVAARGSFTEAATALNLSQPTVSQQVQRLERFVGAQLLHRKSNGVYVSDEGKVFLKHCRACLEAMGTGVRAVAEYSQTIRGEVTIGLTPSASHRCLSEILPQYCQQYPGVAVRVLEDYPDALIAGLQRQTLDLAILSLPIPLENLTVEVLYEEPLMLTLAVNHSLAPIEAIAWETLSNLPFVLPRQRIDLGIRQIIETLFCSRGSQLHPVAEVSGFHSLRQLVLTNFGVTFFPQCLTRQDVAEGKLIVKPVKELFLSHQVALVSQKQHQATLAAEKLAELICTYASKLKALTL